MARPRVNAVVVGAGATIGISDFSHANQGLRGGGMLANEFTRLPYLFSRSRPPDAPRWKIAHKAFQRKYFRRNISVIGPVQEMPVLEARVEVDPVVKDYWGIPVARLSGQRHPHDIEIGRFLASEAEGWLKETGAARAWLRLPGTGLSGGQRAQRAYRQGRRLPYEGRAEEQAPDRTGTPDGAGGCWRG